MSTSDSSTSDSSTSDSNTSAPSTSDSGTADSGTADSANTTVGDLLTALEAHYPPSSAESWDQVGLVHGDPSWPVTRVLLSVDVTREVVAEAIELGADLIVAHHPLLLRGINAVDGRDPKGAVLLELGRHQIACYVAHTNADIAIDGVCAAMARAVGLGELTPLDPRPSRQLDQVVAFVPTGHTSAVVDAMAAAGAGAIGDYDRCHFTVTGTGSFRALEGSSPFVGNTGTVTEVAEDRVEMVLPRRRREAVVTALLKAHPYEEPAWHLIELAPGPGQIGIGRIGTVATPVTASEFAQQVADALPATVTGVRVAGDPDRVVSTVAVLAGAGDSHLDAARRAGADAYLTSDLRHHPASEALEHTDAPVLLDVAHWAAEWTWLPVLADLIGQELPELSTTIAAVRTDPWTASFQPAGR